MGAAELAGALLCHSLTLGPSLGLGFPTIQEREGNAFRSLCDFRGLAASLGGLGS